MNIFYLSNDTRQCAEMHVDKHVVKMILEYSQLLSTAHRVIDGHETAVKSQTGRNKKVWKLSNQTLDISLYESTHVNHPSAIWVRKSKSNYEWLVMMLHDLCAEYTYRYEKKHKVERDGLLDLLYNVPSGIIDKGFCEPTPAMPDEYIDKTSSIKSYQTYYIKDKKHMFSWKNRNIPKFIENILKKV